MGLLWGRLTKGDLPKKATSCLKVTCFNTCEDTPAGPQTVTATSTQSWVVGRGLSGPHRSGAGTHRAVSASLLVFNALNMARWFGGTRSAKAAQSTALRAALRPAMAPPGPGDTGGSQRRRGPGRGRAAPVGNAAPRGRDTGDEDRDRVTERGHGGIGIQRECEAAPEPRRDLTLAPSSPTSLPTPRTSPACSCLPAPGFQIPVPSPVPLSRSPSRPSAPLPLPGPALTFTDRHRRPRRRKYRPLGSRRPIRMRLHRKSSSPEAARGGSGAGGDGGGRALRLRYGRGAAEGPHTQPGPRGGTGTAQPPRGRSGGGVRRGAVPARRRLQVGAAERGRHVLREHPTDAVPGAQVLPVPSLLPGRARTRLRQGETAAEPGHPPPHTHTPGQPLPEPPRQPLSPGGPDLSQGRGDTPGCRCPRASSAAPGCGWADLPRVWGTALRHIVGLSLVSCGQGGGGISRNGTWFCPRACDSQMPLVLMPPPPMDSAQGATHLPTVVTAGKETPRNRNVAISHAELVCCCFGFLIYFISFS